MKKWLKKCDAKDWNRGAGEGYVLQLLPGQGGMAEVQRGKSSIKYPHGMDVKARKKRINSAVHQFLIAVCYKADYFIPVAEIIREHFKGCAFKLQDFIEEGVFFQDAGPDNHFFTAALGIAHQHESGKKQAGNEKQQQDDFGLYFHCTFWTAGLSYWMEYITEGQGAVIVNFKTGPALKQSSKKGDGKQNTCPKFCTGHLFNKIPVRVLGRNSRSARSPP